MKTKSFLPTKFLFFINALLFLSCSKTASTASASTNPPTGSVTNTVSISNMYFNPTSLTVKIGTTVNWTNNDVVAHTVTSNDGTSFDSGNLIVGASFSYKFTTVGNFDYHCSLHAGMTGSIIVTN